MRPRFSLRLMFVVMTVAAGICYWLVRPSLTARRFADAIAVEDFARADQFFDNPNDRFMRDWAAKYWGFRSHAELKPLTLGQLLRGRRHVDVQFAYFYLDKNSSGDAHIVATSFGLKPPIISRAESALLIERRSEAVPRN